MLHGITPTMREFTQEDLIRIYELNDQVQQFLGMKKYFPSLVQDPNTKSNPTAVAKLDEDCLKVLGVSFYWLNMLHPVNHLNTHTKIKEDVCNQIRKLSPTPCSVISTMCQLKINFLKEHYQVPSYQDNYEEVQKGLREGLEFFKKRGAADADVYVKTLEEYFLMEPPDTVSDRFLQDNKKLIHDAFNVPIVYERLQQQPTSLLNFGHHVPFAEPKILEVVNNQHIKEVCHNLATRLSKRQPTRMSLVLNTLVPRKSALKVDSTSLTHKKMQTFVDHPKEYQEYWDMLFNYIPEVISEYNNREFYTSLEKLLIPSNELQEYGSKNAQSWRLIASKVILKSLSYDGLRHRNLLLTDELKLLKMTFQLGYIEDNIDAYFHTVFQVGGLVIPNWNDIKDKEPLKTQFLECVNLLATKKFPSQNSSLRESTLLNFLKGWLLKEGNPESPFITAIFSKWKAIVGTDPSKKLEELHSNVTADFNRVMNQADILGKELEFRTK
jgi:hypothetical protein